MKLGPISVAALTPRRDAGYEADLAAILELVDFLCAAGVNGIALMGSTGEFLHLGIEDRAHLVKLVVKRSRVPVIAGVTHSSLDGTVTLADQAARAGAAAVLVMPPYFFPYQQPEIREFYLRVAGRVAGALPIFLYNIPFFTSPIAPETSCGLLATGLFAGIKDSSGDFDQFLKLKAQREKTPFTFLVGNDVVFTRARSAGADGGVSGVASAIPELMLSLDSAIQAGDAARTDRLETRLQEFIAWLNRFPAPVGVREAAAARGLKVGPLAVPLSPEKQRDLDEFRSWFGSWLPEMLKDCRPGLSTAS
jgi:dihydrodipicolinate synthase/N-acetylneuraminate lyase